MGLYNPTSITKCTTDLSLRIKQSSSRHSNPQLFNNEALHTKTTTYHNKQQLQYDRISVWSGNCDDASGQIQKNPYHLLKMNQVASSKRSRRKATWLLKSAPSLASTKKIFKPQWLSVIFTKFNIGSLFQDVVFFIVFHFQLSALCYQTRRSCVYTVFQFIS